MFQRAVLTLTVAALAGGGLSSVVGLERAKREFPTDPRRDADVSGRLRKYDAEKKTILVVSGEGEEGTRQTTLLVDPHVQVLIDEKPGKLADIPENQTVRVYVNQDRTTALSVQASGPAQRRVIASVDADKRTLSYKREAGAETLAVASDVKVTIDGKDAKLADVKPGSQAILWMSIDQKTVRIIQVGKRRGGDGDRPRKEGEKRDGDKPKEGDRKRDGDKP